MSSRTQRRNKGSNRNRSLTMPEWFRRESLKLEQQVPEQIVTTPAPAAVEPEPEEPVADPLSFRPFPVECLPESVRRFVEANARSMECDESFLALPALTSLAGLIGNSARIRWKRASIGDTCRS